MTKQELEQKIEELKQQLDELKNVKVDETKKRWIPVENEQYCYIDEDLEIESEFFDDDEYDNNLIKLGNCFKTKEEAQSVADKIKYTLMFKKYVEEHSEPLDWENYEQEKWYIYYDFNNNCKCDWCLGLKMQGVIYASSKQILKDAINYIGEENVKKYILGV